MHTRLINRIEYTLTLALTTAGCVFLAHSFGNIRTAQAAGTNQPYSSTWTATQLLGVKLGSSSSSPTIAIGVAEWDVRGALGNAGFKETWSTSGGRTMTAVFDTVTGKKTLLSGNGFVPADWTFAVAGSGQFAFSKFYPFTLNGNTNGHQDFAYGNGAVQCTGSDKDCLYASGMYGFTKAESMSQARSSSQVDDGGLFMPLKWTITGTYCDDKTDAACN